MPAERFSRGLRAALVLGSIALFTPRVDAFCRTTTTTAEAGTCASDGAALFQPAQCLPYRLLNKDSPIIPNAVLSDKLTRAFRAWTAPGSTCTPGLTTIELAPSDATEIAQANPSEEGQNLIGVAPTWRHPDEALSLTTVTFDSTSGRILDADIELNGTAQWSFSDTVAPGTSDLESVLVHEVGHMLGIAHSDDATAVMTRDFTAPVSERRTLAADDQAAVCAIYPNREQRLASSGLVASTACNLAAGDPDAPCADPDISHGCAVQPHTTTAGFGADLVLVLGVIAACRRRR